MKILTVIGARPQFIKAAVVSRAFRKHQHDVSEILVHTGQHYDKNMSEIFFDELDIPLPLHNLGLGGGTHGQNTGRMIEGLERLMLSEKPASVLVYGDTDSTFAGALAAAKLHIPVMHVEAGLRSFNRSMPEEINRVLTDHVADLLFAPTELARKHLLHEGIASEKIHVVGDVMYDAALYYGKLARRPSSLDSDHAREGEFILCTVHRAENTDSHERMQGILDGLKESGLPVIFPLHPRTRLRLQQFELNIPANVRLIDPVGYLEMVWLERNCRIIATDSGGVQKEAYFHGKPCVTLRDETEWTELVHAGFNMIVGTDPGTIASSLLADPAISHGTPLYGDGDSSSKIVEIILDGLIM